MMLDNLARASIEGAIVAALVWVIVKCLPRLPAATRTALWWCVAAKFVLGLAWVSPVELRVLPSESTLYGIAARVAGRVGPRITERVPSRIIERTRLPADGSREASADTTVAAPAAAAAAMPAVSWSFVLIAFWSAGLAVGALIDVHRFRRTRNALRRSSAAPADVERLASSLAEEMGIRRVPLVRVSVDVATPLVAGLLRPHILLPWNGPTPLSAAEQRMALCHELSHVKRADLWLGLVPAAAERLFFFHPLMRLAAREYSLCREAACDAAVIDTVSASAQDYGRLLLTLGVSRHRAGLAVAGASSSCSMLKRRIAMLRDSSASTAGKRALSIVAIAAAATAVLPLRLAARAQAPAAASKPETSATQAATATPPWARELRRIWFGGRVWFGGGDPDQNLVSPADARQASRGNLYVGTGSKDLNYVLLLDDHNANMSGSLADIDRARRFRRGGEPILWIRRNGVEHVVRDSKLVEQALRIWTRVNELGDAQGLLGGKQGALGTQQGALGAQQGAFGLQQGVFGTRQGEIAGRQAVLAAREQAANTAAERRAVNDERRQLDTEARTLEAEMRALDLKIRALDQPMRDLDREMRALGAQMETLGREMEEASRRAEQQMLELIDRAIAGGLAERVK